MYMYHDEYDQFWQNFPLATAKFPPSKCPSKHGGHFEFLEVSRIF